MQPFAATWLIKALLELEEEAFSSQASLLHPLCKSGFPFALNQAPHIEKYINLMKLFTHGNYSQTMSASAQKAVLESKENFIQDLTREIANITQQVEDTREYTEENHRDIAKLEKDTTKLRARIEETRKTISSLKKDAGKAEKVKQMTVILKDKQILYERAQARLQDIKSHLESVKDKSIPLVRHKQALHAKLEAHQQNLVQQKSLNENLVKSQQANMDLKAQKDKIQKQIAKKKLNTGIDPAVITQLLGGSKLLKEYLEIVVDLMEEVKRVDNSIENAKDDAKQLLAKDSVTTDKLVHTLGMKKDDSILRVIEQESQANEEEEMTMSKNSVAYYFRQYMMELKILTILDELKELKQEFNRLNAALEQEVQKMSQIKPEDVTKQNQDEAHKKSEEIKIALNDIKNSLQSYCEQLTHQKAVGDKFQETIRVKCVEQVKERHYVGELHNKDGLKRIQTLITLLFSYDQDMEKILRTKWLQARKGGAEQFKKTIFALSEEAYSIQTSFSGIKLVYGQLREPVKDIENKHISQIHILLNHLTQYQRSLSTDHIKLEDLEKRVEEIKEKYQSILSEMCTETVSYVTKLFAQKDDQAQLVLKNEQDLEKFLEIKKTRMYSIKEHIEDCNEEFSNLYQTYYLLLLDAFADAERATDNQREIIQKLERLQRNQNKISPFEFKSLYEVWDVVDATLTLEGGLKATQELIDEAYKKVKDLDVQLSDLEKKIKDQRIKACEDEIKFIFINLDKLKKLTEKGQLDLKSINTEQLDLQENSFKDAEKHRHTGALMSEVKLEEEHLLQIANDRMDYQKENEVLHKEFQERLKSKEQSPVGELYFKIRKETEFIKFKVVTDIQTLEGPVAQDISSFNLRGKELIKNFKAKHDRYKKTVNFRNTKAEEFKRWYEALLSMQERQKQIEDQLKEFGYSKQSEKQHFEYLQKLDEIRQTVLRYEFQVKANQRILGQETQELDEIENRLIKIARLDEIYKLLEQMKVTMDGFDMKVTNLDQGLVQLTKEIEDYMMRIREKVYKDCNGQVVSLQTNIEKLVEKSKEVNEDMSSFRVEFEANKQKLRNEERIRSALVGLEGEMGSVDEEKQRLSFQVDDLKARFQVLIKPTMLISQCGRIQEEAEVSIRNVDYEHEKAEDIHRRLKKLIALLRSLIGDEAERLKRLQRAKQLILDNKELLRRMKLQLGDAAEKNVHFQQLYNSMLRCEAYYAKRKVQTNKKMSKNQKVNNDCGQYSSTRDDLEVVVYAVNLEELEHKEDDEEIKDVIEEQLKINVDLKKYVGTMEVIVKKYDTRRKKVVDAEVRTNAGKIKIDSEKLGKEIKGQIDNLSEFDKLLQQAMEQKHKLSPEQQEFFTTELNRFNIEFKDLNERHVKFNTQVATMNIEIQPKDLENKEILPVLANYIDTLQILDDDFNRLKVNLGLLAVQLKTDKEMLESLDGESKLRDMLARLRALITENQESIDNIRRMIALTESYDGYTSGGEDSQFFSGMGSNSKQLLKDLLKQNDVFDKMFKDIEAYVLNIDTLKEKAGGKLANADIVKINEQIKKMEVTFIKTSEDKIKIDNTAVDNKEKMADHELEKKIARRQEETTNIDIAIDQVVTEGEEFKNHILQEIESCQGNKLFDKYVEKLKAILAETDEIQVRKETFKQQNHGIKVEADQLLTDVNQVEVNVSEKKQKVNSKLDSFDSHLVIKKKITDVQKEVNKGLNMYMKSLKDKLAAIKKPVPAAPQAPAAFKVDPNDLVDKMLAEALLKLNCSLTISRMGGGYYMFGTKKIYCKIINGKLVVRVGGGYMGIEEFISVYGKQEEDRIAQAKALQEGAAQALEKQGAMQTVTKAVAAMAQGAKKK